MSSDFTARLFRTRSFAANSTPYGLYRDGTELRGVYYSKPEVAREACLSLGDQCDFPILMGQHRLGSCTVVLAHAY